MYQSLCELERNMYIKRPWTENRRISYQATRKRKDEEKRIARQEAEELKATQALEDGETPDPSSLG